MTDPDFPADLIERCAKAALANHKTEIPSTTLSWDSHDGKAAAYASSTARAVLRASGHADLVAALREAREFIASELEERATVYCAGVDYYDTPASALAHIDAALRKAGAAP